MGTLRTLFAIAVVLEHSFGSLLIGGKNAVQLFYMISGFLISYVLVERKSYANVKSFYINRYLRLYPIYFVIAILTLLAFTIASLIGNDIKFFQTYNNAPYAATILLTVSNITLFFQDWVMFAGIESNKLAFTTDFSKSEVVLYPALLVPQAWTLGVELTFYLLAPLILQKKRIIFSLLCLSIVLRIYLISIGLGTKDPWNYRFFPTELALFLLGALAHQILLPLYKKILPEAHIEKYSCAATYFLMSFTILFSFIPLTGGPKTIALFTAFLALMPLTFIFQSNRGWDRWIGDLSYPIYISHMLVIYLSTFALQKLALTREPLFLKTTGSGAKVLIGLCAVIFSIFFAMALNKFVGGHVESLRNRYRSKTPG